MTRSVSKVMRKVAPTRKLRRAALRKQAKMNKAINYAKSKNTEKICVSSGDIKLVKSILGSEFNTAELKGKSLTNMNLKTKTKPHKKSKSKKKKKDIQKVNSQDIEEEDSFKLINSNNDRMSKLKQFVNAQSKNMSIDDSEQEADDSLEDLRIGQAEDNKEINNLSRKLHLNAHQKKKLHPTYRDDFETLLGDIEGGNMSNLNMYKDAEMFNSDDEFEQDLDVVFGADKIGSDESGSSNNEEEQTDEEMDEDDESENESGREFLDDEAIEDDEDYESNSECSEDSTELAFASGSSVGSSKYEKQRSRNGSLTANGMFEDDESSENEGSEEGSFVVDNNELSFESEDSDNLSELELACEAVEDDCKNISSKREIKSILKLKVSKHEKNKISKSKNRRSVSFISSTEESEDEKIKINKSKKRKRVSLISSTEESEDDEKNKMDKSKNRSMVSLISSEESENGEDPVKTLKNKPENQEIHEDIYGRLRDKSGNVVKSDSQELVGKKYIPPALRKLNALNKGEEKQKIIAELTRNLKGLLNKLSENNLSNIARQVEVFYQKNSRNDVNEVLTKLLVSALISPVLSNERLIQEHALLVAILSAHVDFEVGAHILSEFVVKWNEQLQSYIPPDEDSDTKELDNFILFIVHLYNFNVVDATLIYGILMKMAKSFQRKEIELILVVLRSVGFTLRKDNPILLKEFISYIQGRATELSNGQNEDTYSRVKFMLEILVALRNNNIAKMPNYDPSHGQHLKLLLKSILRRGCYCSPINVSLDDLLRSQTSGKWWLVGSAWSGDRNENKNKQISDGLLKTSKYSGLCDEMCFSKELKIKAAKLHLTRQPRISIFYILTEGSEDVDEAYDKLIRLKLPHIQNKEIFSVLFICLLRGKVYNPFFGCLVSKLCVFDRKLKYQFQKSLWDQFRELPNIKTSYISNLSKFTADVVGDGEINVSILGYDLFMNSSQSVISFIRQTLMALMMDSKGVSSISTVFSHLLKPQLNTLRQCFKLFISKFINTKDKEDEKIQVLYKRKKIVLDILSSGDGFSL